MATTQIPFWGDTPEAWDQGTIDGNLVPGIMDVEVNAESGIDERRSPRTHRSVLVDQGYRLARGYITVTLGFEPLSPGYGTPRSQWEAWQALEEKIRPKRAQKRIAHSVVHPKLAIKGIKQVYFTKIGSLQGKGPGVRTIRIDFVEFGPVEPMQVTSGAVTAQPKLSTDLSSLRRAQAPSATETGPNG